MFAENGAQPFTGDQLGKMRKSAGEDLLAFLLLRWTGMRGSDCVHLSWSEVDFGAREISRLTLKRKKRVCLPIAQELLFALEVEHERRKPEGNERVLLNPATNEPLRRPTLYRRMVALGKRAGVADAHPHRFRDTLACDLLLKGASRYEVAKADEVATVERHYAPFVRELRDRARRFMDSGEGLENCTIFTQSPVKPASVQ